MALSSRIRSLERSEAKTCPICADQNEATLVIRPKVVKAGDERTTRQPLLRECPACKRRIKITKVVVVRDKTV
jgi:hypothetical protein